MASVLYWSVSLSKFLEDLDTEEFQLLAESAGAEVFTTRPHST